MKLLKTNDSVVEKIATYKNYKYIIIFHPAGHRCGYVILSKNDRYYKKEYNDIDVSCHWGLTYSDTLEELINNIDIFNKYKLDKTDWVIGFDCAHCTDLPDTETWNKYFGDDKEYLICKPLEESYYKSISYKNSSIKTLDFCIRECKKIINQLA